MKNNEKLLDTGLVVVYHVTCLATMGFPCMEANYYAKV